MELKLEKDQIDTGKTHILFPGGGFTFLLSFCYQPDSGKGEMFMCDGVVADVTEGCKMIRKALIKEESDALILAIAQANYYNEIRVSRSWSYFDKAEDAYMSVGYDDMRLAQIVNSAWFKGSADGIQQQILDANAAGLTHCLGEFYDLALRYENNSNEIIGITKLTIPEPWTFSRVRIDYVLEDAGGFLNDSQHTARKMCLNLPLPHKKNALQELSYEDFSDYAKTLRQLRVARWNPKEILEWEKARLA